MSVSTMINDAATALDEYESPAYHATSRRIWCWRARRYITMQVADLGQKPHITPARGNEQIMPTKGDIMRTMKIKGLRREIIELLQSEGPLSTADIAERLGTKAALIVKIVGNHSEFYRIGESQNAIWHLDTEWLNQALSTGMVIFTKSPIEIITEHIEQHGPSTVKELHNALGSDPRYILLEHFQVVQPEASPVWGITEQAMTTRFAYRSIAALAIDVIKDIGPTTVAVLAERIDKTTGAVSATLKKYTDFFFRVTPHQYARWGFK